MGQLKLVISTHAFLPTVGGAELGIHEIAKRLASEFDVTVVAAGDPRPFNDHAPAGYRVIRATPTRSGRRSLLDRVLEYTGVAFAVQLARLRRSNGVDVVNCHFLKRHMLLVLVCRYVWRVPVVVSLVGRSDVVAKQPWPARGQARLVLSRAAATVTNSSYYLRGSGFEGRERIIPFGVDLRRFRTAAPSSRTRASLGLAEDQFVVIAVQRLERLKRVDMLLSAIAEAIRFAPQLRLVIVGTGSEEQRLRAMAVNLGIADAVRFTGYVSEAELPALFTAADAFASHSESETFGVTFAEAMAAGLPIVAANTSCIPDVLTSAESEIVTPEDVEAFARVLISWASEPAQAAAKGAAGMARAQRSFDWDRIAESYGRLFRDLLASAG